MRIFLTGATGFIGGALARRLLLLGHQVTCLVRSPEKAKPLQEAGARLAPGDITDTASLDAAMPGHDAVIHAAALYEIGPIDKEKMVFTNVEGTRRVLEACRRHKMKTVLYVSSVAAKGETGGAVVDETFEHKQVFTTWYEYTKWSAHQLARKLREGGLPLRIVMPGVVYGPGDTSSIGRYIKDWLSRTLPARLGEGSVYTFVYIDDVVDGIVRILDRGRDGEEYLLAGMPHLWGDLGREITALSGVRGPRMAMPALLGYGYAWVAETLGRWTGVKPLVTREGVRSVDDVCMAYDSGKAIRQLGWRPRGLAEGLRPTLESLGYRVRNPAPAPASNAS